MCKDPQWSLHIDAATAVWKQWRFISLWAPVWGGGGLKQSARSRHMMAVVCVWTGIWKRSCWDPGEERPEIRVCLPCGAFSWGQLFNGDEGVGVGGCLLTYCMALLTHICPWTLHPGREGTSPSWVFHSGKNFFISARGSLCIMCKDPTLCFLNLLYLACLLKMLFFFFWWLVFKSVFKRWALVVWPMGQRSWSGPTCIPAYSRRPRNAWKEQLVSWNVHTKKSPIWNTFTLSFEQPAATSERTECLNLEETIVCWESKANTYVQLTFAFFFSFLYIWTCKNVFNSTFFEQIWLAEKKQYPDNWQSLQKLFNWTHIRSGDFKYCSSALLYTCAPWDKVRPALKNDIFSSDCSAKWL